MKSLLIANRGEIARRIIRTAKRMGVRTVAVWSDADRDALHVREADAAVRIGAASPRESYLNSAAIVAAARQAGADAVHPGYGFLAENADFAQGVIDAGLTWVGPPPAVIRQMGDKAEAKRIARAAGVPVIPGYDEADQSDGALTAAAKRTGYPVMVKAAAGGGGRGMRRVMSQAEMAPALKAARSEAEHAFGDGRLLLERALTGARHIEVQVFADQHGNVVHLGERDCSVQRRHQKLIEESPSPAVDAALRDKLGAAAVTLAKAVNYVGAGTVEFLLDANNDFFFMEMNTRLQVEHPVTEMITGLDLVEWQLRVAAGEKLPLGQSALAIRGHAIEARVYAEDPSRDFLPSIGRLEYLVTPPTSASVRIDTGVRPGDEITPYYDPMIAKLIVHGATRDEAVARMRSALADYHVAGVHTNIEFLHRLMGVPSFVEARLDTALIERERERLFVPREAASRPLWDLAALVHVLALNRGRGAHSPWEDVDGWRTGASGQRHWKLGNAGKTENLRVTLAGSAVRVEIGGEVHRVSGLLEEHGGLEATVDGVVLRAHAFTSGATTHLYLDGEHHVFEWIDPYLPESIGGDHRGGLVAPMPGRVIAVLVEAGAKVAAGAALVVMEAMKMEHTVTAPSAGVIAAVHCAVGDQVREGAELLRLE